MKIVVTANSRFPVGSANSVNVFRMASAFAELGHDVSLLALCTRGAARRNAWEVACRRYGESREVKAYLLPWYPERVAESYLTTLHGAYLTRAPRETLVYTRVLYVAALSAALGYQVIYESHQPPAIGFRGRLERNFSCRHGTRTVVISDGLRQRYMEVGYDPEQFLVAPDAARQLRTTPEAREFQGPATEIGYTGSLYEGRGFEIIRALATAEPKRRFHIVGDSSPVAAQVGSLPDNLLLYDLVTPDQAERLCALFDVLLMPYQKIVRLSNNLDTSAWMSPMKMFEYMLAGRPLISSDLPVLREILTDNTNALLVPYDDLASWQAALHSLDDPLRRFSLAERAFDSAQREHTWLIRAQRIIDWAVPVPSKSTR